MRKASYKIVFGYSFDKKIKEIELYQISIDEVGNNSVVLLCNYGDCNGVHEYLEISTEDANVASIIFGLFIEKMEFQTPILDVDISEIGSRIEENSA